MQKLALIDVVSLDELDLKGVAFIYSKNKPDAFVVAPEEEIGYSYLRNLMDVRDVRIGKLRFSGWKMNLAELVVRELIKNGVVIGEVKYLNIDDENA